MPVRMPDEILLLVDGAVENRLELRYADLAAIARVATGAGRFTVPPEAEGEGGGLAAILEQARPGRRPIT